MLMHLHKITLHIARESDSFSRLLTLMRKAGCQSKILGGSLDFTGKMTDNAKLELANDLTPMFLIDEECES